MGSSAKKAIEVNEENKPEEVVSNVGENQEENTPQVSGLKGSVSEECQTEEAAPKLGIVQTKELLKAIHIIVDTIDEIAEGGIDLSDVPKLFAAAKDYKVIVAGIKDCAEVKDELRDLDASEVREIGDSAVDIVLAILD